MFPVDILNPYQKRINSLHFFAYKKSETLACTAQERLEKCTLGKNRVKLQINSRKIAPRMGKGIADNGSVRKTSQNPLPYGKTGKCMVLLLQHYIKTHSRDQSHLI